MLKGLLHFSTNPPKTQTENPTVAPLAKGHLPKVVVHSLQRRLLDVVVGVRRIQTCVWIHVFQVEMLHLHQVNVANPMPYTYHLRMIRYDPFDEIWRA